MNTNQNNKPEEKTGAEMRYISNQLYQFIQQYKEMCNHDNMVQAQRDLTTKLQKIPLGMILNPPLNHENKPKQKEQEKEKDFIKI